MPQHLSQLDDKMLMSDCLSSQKFLTCSYNMAVTESASDQLRRDFMTIYQEEQNNLKQIFNAMQTRGWYQLTNASAQDIAQVQQQFRNIHQAQAGREGAAWTAARETAGREMGERTLRDF